jgi:uncharacterized membrane protein YdjX (TVP38/TMEM64 family)
MDRERLEAFLDSLGPLSFIGFILLQIVQVVTGPVPGEVTGFIGGFIYGKGLGLFLSTIGLTLGSWAAYMLSKTFGRPFVERFVKKETLVFLLFLIPGSPKDILCYILGLGTLSTRLFLIISTAGRFAGTVLLTFGGSYIRNHQYYRFSILLTIAIIIIFLSLVYKERLERVFRIWHIKERRKERKERKEREKLNTNVKSE